MKELIPYVLSKLSDDPKTHLLEKVRDMRKKKVLLALGKRQLELEAKLSEQQNPDEPYIDQVSDMQLYEELLKKRDTMDAEMDLKIKKFK